MTRRRNDDVERPRYHSVVSRSALLVVILFFACRPASGKDTPAAADSEHRGIAIAPLPTADPTGASSRAPLANATGTSQAEIGTGDGGQALDRARALYLGGDKGGARTLLEPRVFAHTATTDEVRFLKDICKEQGDQACRDKIKQMYP